MGTTNTLDLNNRVGALKKVIEENAVGTHDIEKDIYAVMGKMGAKNLNSYPYYETSHTYNGIDWTDNGDGTVTANNTATATSSFLCHKRASTTYELFIPNGTYILSGCPSGGSSTKYDIIATITKNGSAVNLGIDYGDGATIIVNGDDNYTDKVRLQIGCNVKNGYKANNLTFKPMLRLASDTDDTYQPYAKTNKELTDEIITKVPDAPTTDGAYNLKATVVDGAPTYSWVSTS